MAGKGIPGTQICADGANIGFIAFNTMYMSCQPTMLCWLRGGAHCGFDPSPGNFLKEFSKLLYIELGYPNKQLTSCNVLATSNGTHYAVAQ